MLNGWKQIAGYVHREVRTAMRWADERGLPVHRAPGRGRGTVYALPSEIDAWLAANRASLAAPASSAFEAPIIAREPVGPIITVPALPRWPQHRWRVTALICNGVTLAVVGALALELARSGSFTAAKPSAHLHTSNDLGARDLYLRGRAAWWQRTPSSLAKATRLFGDAVARDPRMADAYVGLADAWLLRREYAAVPQAEAFERADAAADAALTIDPTLPSAVRAKGFIDFWSRRDEAKGLAELRQAVSAVPNDAQSHHWLSTALGTSGDHRGALREINAARELDPANPAILADRASALMYAGRLQEAIAASREILAIDPAQSNAHALLATELLIMGDAAGYARSQKAAASLRGEAAAASLYSKAADAFAPGALPSARHAIALRAEAALHAGWLRRSDAARLVSLAGDHVDAKAIWATGAAQHDFTVFGAPIVPL